MVPAMLQEPIGRSESSGATSKGHREAKSDARQDEGMTFIVIVTILVPKP